MTLAWGVVVGLGGSSDMGHQDSPVLIRGGSRVLSGVKCGRMMPGRSMRMTNRKERKLV